MSGLFAGAGDLTVAVVIAVQRDTDKAWTVTLQNPNGTPFDTTLDGGWTVDADLRSEIDGGTVSLAWTIGISGASNEIVTLSATAAELSAIPAGCYFTDVRLINDGDQRVKRPNLAPAGRPPSHIVQVNLQGRVTAT